MKNLKICVNSESESKEIQELFFELGYNWFKKGYMEVKTPETIMSFENGALSTGIRGSINHKEITLPELRDLVVLKRNDVGDANYKTNYGTQCYITGEDVYAFQDNKWFLSAMQHKDILDMIKPIKKPMKEYLRKNNDGEYILEVTDEREAQEPHAKHWIEIPGGAEKLTARGLELIFWTACGNYSWHTENSVEWDNNKELGLTSFDQYFDNETVILWQRHTHPEELPFIDDEPLQNLNDQYAEIEKVRQTLNQRQSQYGSFEDVAMFTEQMVDVMRKGYYEKLAYNQKMALYMICSKMARIVNGDPNHKSLWHDIAGYATLIDNELVSEKDMPF